MQINYLLLQIFALFSQIAQLAAKPFRRLISCREARLERVVNQSLREPIDNGRGDGWLEAQVSNLDEPGAGNWLHREILLEDLNRKRSSCWRVFKTRASLIRQSPRGDKRDEPAHQIPMGFEIGSLLQV